MPCISDAQVTSRTIVNLPCAYRDDPDRRSACGASSERRPSTTIGSADCSIDGLCLLLGKYCTDTGTPWMVHSIRRGNWAIVLQSYLVDTGSFPAAQSPSFASSDAFNAASCRHVSSRTALQSCRRAQKGCAESAQPSAPSSGSARQLWLRLQHHHGAHDGRALGYTASSGYGSKRLFH